VQIQKTKTASAVEKETGRGGTRKSSTWCVPQTKVVNDYQFVINGKLCLWPLIDVAPTVETPWKCTKRINEKDIEFFKGNLRHKASNYHIVKY